MPPSQASDQLNGSPIPPQQTSPRPLFGFGEPTTPAGPPSNPPQSPESPSLESELLEALEPDSEDDWPDDGSESPSGTTSPGSTRVSNPLNGAGLRDMARAGVAIAGDQAHNFLATTEGQKAVGLYKTDEDDQAAIGDPLARLAGRHQGIGEVSEDTADLLASLLGLARYGTKQINRSQAAKRLDAGAPAAAAEGPVDL